MNFIPLVQSKLITPEVPLKTLYVDRFKNLHMEKKRITVITAPAGFGKTTVVLLALKKVRNQIHWYRMEKEDRNLPIFYLHLIETLFSDRDKTSLESYKILSSIQNIEEEYPLVNAQICQDAADLNREKIGLYLVFDDVHNVIENKSIVDSIRYFAINMPDVISIIVTSRIETDILTGKLSIDQRAQSITEEDLRFTREETQKLISGIYKIKYSEQKMTDIFMRSEGWIAGIHIMCHNNIDLPDQEQQESQESAFKQYFKEFFNGLDNKHQTILMQLSIFEDFSVEEIETLLGYSQAVELLDWLEKSNLYVQKIQAQSIRFRFHTLFRIELQRLLEERMKRPDLLALFLKTAEYYSKRQLQTAIYYYMLAGQRDTAIQLAVNESMIDFEAGRPDRISYTMKEFSDKDILENPYLLFFHGVTMMNSDMEESARCIMKSFEAFKENRDMSFLMNAFGVLMIMAFQKYDFELTKKYAKLLPKRSILRYGGIPRKKLMMIAFIGAAGDDRLHVSTWLLSICNRIKLENPTWDYSFLMIKTLVFIRRGKLKEAKEYLIKLYEHAFGRSNDNWRIVGLVSCQNLLFLQRDLTTAELFMNDFSQLGEKYDSDFSRAFAYRLHAFTYYQTGLITEAMEQIDKAIETYAAFQGELRMSIDGLVKQIWQEDSDPNSISKAEERIEVIESENAGKAYLDFSICTLGILYKRQGEFKKAEENLLKAYHSAKRKGALQNMCGAALHMIDLYFLTGKTRKAINYLKKWMNCSEKHGYVYYLEMDYTTLIRVCLLAIKEEINEKYSKKILILYFGTKACEDVRNNIDFFIKHPLNFMTCHQSKKEMKRQVVITLFGAFKVSGKDFTLTEENFKTRKISGILKYLIVNRERPVSREKLTGIFWPDSDSKAAFMSLRVALSELRKVVADCNMAFDSDKALLCENKSGLYLNEELDITIDTIEFMKLYQQSKAPSTREASRIEILTRILGYYEGDLLEENPYDDWLMASRERYRAIYLEIAHELAAWYYKEKEYTKSEEILNKSLSIEPLDEVACGLLIRVFNATGQESRAVILKHNFEKRYLKEMGQKPKVC